VGSGYSFGFVRQEVMMVRRTRSTHISIVRSTRVGATGGSPDASHTTSITNDMR